MSTRDWHESYKLGLSNAHNSGYRQGLNGLVSALELLVLVLEYE